MKGMTDSKQLLARSNECFSGDVVVNSQSAPVQTVPVEVCEAKSEPSFQQLFCNQQSLWKSNNKLMGDFLEFMKNRISISFNIGIE